MSEQHRDRTAAPLVGPELERVAGAGRDNGLHEPVSPMRRVPLLDRLIVAFVVWMKQRGR